MIKTHNNKTKLIYSAKKVPPAKSLSNLGTIAMVWTYDLS